MRARGYVKGPGALVKAYTVPFFGLQNYLSL